MTPYDPVGPKAVAKLARIESLHAPFVAINDQTGAPVYVCEHCTVLVQQVRLDGNSGNPYVPWPCQTLQIIYPELSEDPRATDPTDSFTPLAEEEAVELDGSQYCEECDAEIPEDCDCDDEGFEDE